MYLGGFCLHNQVCLCVSVCKCLLKYVGMILNLCVVHGSLCVCVIA